MRKQRFKNIRLFLKLILLFKIYSHQKFTAEAIENNSFIESFGKCKIGDNGTVLNDQISKNETVDTDLERPKRPARLLPLKMILGEDKPETESNLKTRFYGPATSCEELLKIGYTRNGFYLLKGNATSDNSHVEIANCAFQFQNHKGVNEIREERLGNITFKSRSEKKFYRRSTDTFIDNLAAPHSEVDLERPKRAGRLLPLQLLFGRETNYTEDSNIPKIFYGPPTNCTELGKLGYTLNGYYLINGSKLMSQIEVAFCQFQLPPDQNKTTKEERLGFLSLDSVTIIGPQNSANDGFKAMAKETRSSTILSRKSRPARLIPLKLLFNNDEENQTEDKTIERNPEEDLRLKSNPASCNDIKKLGYTLNGYYLVNNSATAARFGVFFCQFKLPPGFDRNIIKEDILGYLNLSDGNEKNNDKKESPGFGIQYSIGKNPYPPSSFFPDETWGINNGRDNRWPNGIIPYTFDYTSSDPADNITLTPALAVQQIALFQGLMNSTCVKFVPRTNKETDYITIGFSTDCSSFIGRIGGQQLVGARPSCFPSANELMHVLGFEREENRRDRDYYMALNWTNIRPETNIPTYGIPLDQKSVTMTPQKYIAINSSYPVYNFADGSSQDFYSKVKYFSEGDRQKINRAYNCIPEDSCWDEDPFNCPVWAAAGACKDPDWVFKTACPKKCCHDKWTSGCVNNKFYCNKSSLSVRCNKTCNFCPVKDNRDDCQYIGATLGCNQDLAKWPGGMTKYCKKSCGFCTRPAVVNIPPMILTKCQKTCNLQCYTNIGCNHLARPKPNYWSDSYCKGGWSDADLLTWCKTSSNAAYCQTICYNLGYRTPCPSQCVDADPVNCSKLAATKGCFSLFDS